MQISIFKGDASGEARRTPESNSIIVQHAATTSRSYKDREKTNTLLEFYFSKFSNNIFSITQTKLLLLTWCRFITILYAEMTKRLKYLLLEMYEYLAETTLILTHREKNKNRGHFFEFIRLFFEQHLK